MATKKNMRISYPSSEKIYVPGEINKIKVGMRKIKLLDTQVYYSFYYEYNFPHTAFHEDTHDHK